MNSIIKLAKLSFCHNFDCEVMNGLHLEIDIEKTELSTSKAIAISYTWGEFDRRQVKIGHGTGEDATKIYEMCLGQEWNIDEFCVKLAMLCIDNGELHGKEHAGCWIDQLCIAQEDDHEIRRTLATIPSIYKSLDAVALMPGGICGCLKKFWENGGDDFSLTQRTNSSACLNMLGPCSYFDRVWTRQELMYSRTIRVERVCDEELPCVKSVHEAEFLSPYLKIFFDRRMADGVSKDEAYFTTQTKASHFLSQNLPNSLFGFRPLGWDLQVKTSALATRFLLGQPFQNVGRMTPSGREGLNPLALFLINLSVLARSSRKATRLEDYVTSVWVDCPGYVIPEDFKTRGLPSLLQDAIQQLETNHNLSPFVTCLGLHGTVLWRPAEYLSSSKDVEGIGELYSVIWHVNPLYVTKSSVLPLRIDIRGGDRVPPLSEHAQEYSSLFARQSARQVLLGLIPVCRNWTEHAKRNWEFSLRNLTAELGESGPGLGASMWSQKNLFTFQQVLSMLAGSTEEELGMVREILLDKLKYANDHYEPSYQMVASVLGLDRKVCQDKGLQLVVSLRNPPRIGLMRATPSSYDPKDVMTISLADSELKQAIMGKPGDSTRQASMTLLESPILEGLKVKAPSPSRQTIIEIIGIWIPFVNKAGFTPGAEICHEGGNGFIIDRREAVDFGLRVTLDQLSGL